MNYNQGDTFAVWSVVEIWTFDLAYGLNSVIVVNLQVSTCSCGHNYIMDVPISTIKANVLAALQEDLGTGDVHSALTLENTERQGFIISRSHGILCGCAWADEAYRQVSPQVRIEWKRSDGDSMSPNDPIASISGPVNTLLAVERTVLNFLQLLSATATRTRDFVQLIEHTQARVLDTRKTVPGLRIAQEYAVRCGSGTNHRFGLFDAFLIKENHIAAAGGIEQAVRRARTSHPKMFVEVEVETLEELEQALRCDVDRIMLDNFKILQLREAVRLARGYSGNRKRPIQLEASGGISRSNVVQVAETGVDYISLGTLTKDVTAIDFSFRIAN